MITIVPRALSLTTTNVAASSYGEWMATTAYSVGNNVVVTLTATGAPTTPHYEYEALTTGTNLYPPTSPTNWLELGTTNQYRMLDDYVSTQSTVATGNLVATVQLTATGSVDRLALFNAETASVTVTVTATGQTTYATTVYMQKNASQSWSEYFFANPDYAQELVQMIPPYLNPTVSLTLTPLPTATGGAEVGHVVLGNARIIGDSQWGFQTQIDDYSTKTTDDFGRTVFTERAYAKWMSGNVWLDTANAGTVSRLLSALRATPCAWDANDNGSTYGPLIVFGWASNWKLGVDLYTKTQLSIEITGLT